MDIIELLNLHRNFDFEHSNETFSQDALAYGDLPLMIKQSLAQKSC